MRTCNPWLARISALTLMGPAVVLADEAIDANSVNAFWGVSAEKFEYRYSDSDEKLAVIESDAWYGSDELKFRWQFTGEW